MRLTDLSWLVLMLMLTAAGCERELARSSEPRQQELEQRPAKSTMSKEAMSPPIEKPTKSFTGAAVDGDVRQVQLHLARGTHINEKTIFGDTARHYAAKYGHTDLVELLIDKGAKVNSRDRDGETPAHIAISRHYREIVDLLVAKGAAISPVHLAAYRADLATVIRSVKEQIDVNKTDEAGFTLLYIAASSGQKEMVEYLIGQGASTNCARNPDHWTPLYAATNAGYKDVVELLVTKGAGLDVKNSDGFTPFTMLPAGVVSRGGKP